MPCIRPKSPGSLYVLRLVLFSHRTLTTNTTTPPPPHPTLGPSPLTPSFPVDAYGLPLTPLPPAIPSIPHIPISREKLHKLHRLSALIPPAADSEEERELLAELGQLVGLMELVKSVELPEGREGVGELLTEGVGEVLIGEPDAAREGVAEGEKKREGEKGGRELLAWGTRTVGDYYAHGVSKKDGSS